MKEYNKSGVYHMGCIKLKLEILFFFNLFIIIILLEGIIIIIKNSFLGCGETTFVCVWKLPKLLCSLEKSHTVQKKIYHVVGIILLVPAHYYFSYLSDSNLWFYICIVIYIAFLYQNITSVMKFEFIHFNNTLVGECTFRGSRLEKFAHPKSKTVQKISYA